MTTSSRTARLRTVELFPYAGRPDRPWADTPAADALVKSARRVSERYSELISAYDLRARSSEFRIFAEAAPTAGTAVQLVVQAGWFGTFESARVLELPPGLVALDDEARAFLSLEIQHHACLALGRVLAWPTEPFTQVRATLMEEGLSPVWHGPWNSSPDRRLRARVAQRITGDGFAELWVEICPRDHQQPLGRGPFSPGPGNLAGFSRAVKAMRWQSATTVELVTSHWSGDHLSKSTTTIDELSPDLPVAGSPVLATPALPAVNTHLMSYDDPTRPPQVRLGEIHGGPGKVPKSFRNTWQKLRAAEDLLLPWWAAGGWATLQVDVVPDLRAGGHSTRRTGRDLDVLVVVDCFKIDEATGAQVAVDALQTGIDLAARRAKIDSFTLPGEVLDPA